MPENIPSFAEDRVMHNALRKALGYLHPDVEPKFFNGSIVTKEGQTYHVVNRTIDWEGVATYTLQPVDVVVMKPRDAALAKLDEQIALASAMEVPYTTEQAFTQRVGIMHAPGFDDSPTVVSIEPKGDPLFEVAEAELTPLLPEHLSQGKSERLPAPVISQHESATLNEGAEVIQGGV